MLSTSRPSHDISRYQSDHKAGRDSQERFLEIELTSSPCGHAMPCARNTSKYLGVCVLFPETSTIVHSSISVRRRPENRRHVPVISCPSRRVNMCNEHRAPRAVWLAVLLAAERNAKLDSPSEPAYS